MQSRGHWHTAGRGRKAPGPTETSFTSWVWSRMSTGEEDALCSRSRPGRTGPRQSSEVCWVQGPGSGATHMCTHSSAGSGATHTCTHRSAGSRPRLPVQPVGRSKHSDSFPPGRWRFSGVRMLSDSQHAQHFHVPSLKPVLSGRRAKLVCFLR